LSFVTAGLTAKKKKRLKKYILVYCYSIKIYTTWTWNLH